MRKIYKQYYRCSTQNNAINGVLGDEVTILLNAVTFNGLRTGENTYTSVPAWITQINGFPSGSVTWRIVPPAESDTEYEFSWTGELKDQTQIEEVEYIVKLSMIDYCDIELGCDNPTTGKPLTMLLWLTREGGWTYFPFVGRKSFEVKIPDAETYMNDEYVMRNTSRKGVMNGETLSTGDIPELALDLLQSLKESISVYYVENPLDEYEQIYYPVNLMDGDFVKRKTGEKKWDVKVKFLYATERQMQSQ